MSLIEQAAKRLEELRLVPPQDADPAQPEAAASRALPDRPAPSVVPPHAVLASASESSPPSRASAAIELDLSVVMSWGMQRSPGAPSPLIDEFRILKRPLLDNASGKGAELIPNGNLIMVTSAISGEGKSFCAVNLALSITMEVSRHVLLVDADVARPSLLKLFGLSPRKGLLDLLQGRCADLSEVLLRTNVDRLTFLPSGSHAARANELLASDVMSHLVEDLAGRYPDRIIIFDAPPLLPTTEARVLATHMGQIVMVVRADHTKRGDVTAALAAIESCPVKLMVLNGASQAAQGAYGYGYGIRED